MDILNSIILGFIQGITEFLPISSSGHLILARDFLNISNINGLAFDAVLQLATTMAILVYFLKDILLMFSSKKLLSILIIATIPAVVLGLFLENFMETVFRSSELVASTLVIGALIMFFADRYNNKKTINKNQLSIKKSFLIGLFQSLALIPGMSRSGMTISGGLFNGLSREEATRFSFLLAFPILFGSGIKKLLDLYNENMLVDFGTPLIFGSISAFLVGILAIHFLIKFLKTHTMKIFIIYRILLAILILVIL